MTQLYDYLVADFFVVMLTKDFMCYMLQLNSILKQVLLSKNCFLNCSNIFISYESAAVGDLFLTKTYKVIYWNFITMKDRNW